MSKENGRRKERGGQDDPCSECRHFGGETAECVVVPNKSYNDSVWAAMIGRQIVDYSLPDFKPRNEPKKLKKSQIDAGVQPGPGPQPMPDDKVKSGWEGRSKDELLATPDMLPAGVRACPRAYVVVPGAEAFNKDKRTAEWMAENEGRVPKKTKIDDAGFAAFKASAITVPPGYGAAPGYAAAPMYPAPPMPLATPTAAPLPPPGFPRPPPHPWHGPIMKSTWDWETQTWQHFYH